eukprot:2843557-Rhodomonas_salina.1
MSGTGIAYGAICPCDNIAYGTSCLRARYAMSGAKIAYGGISLRACNAMSGADIPYGDICLCACYAMSGTDIGSASTAASWSRSRSTRFRTLL